MVLSSDHITGATGLTPTVVISKGGTGPFATPMGAVSEIGSGWYQVAGNAIDANTLGPLLLNATAGSADPSSENYIVILPPPSVGACANPSVGSQYITPADLASFYDSRRVLQLAVDSTTPALITDLSNASTPAYQTVNQAILTAASDIDSHAQVGQRYSPSDLNYLIINWQNNPTIPQYAKSAALLRQLTADLAFGILAARRGYAGDTLKMYAPRYEPALVTLERLAEGYQVFNLCAQLNASIPQIARIAGGVTRPSRWNRMFGVGYVGDSTIPNVFGG